MEISSEKKKCPICNGSKIEFQYTTHDRHYGYSQEDFNVFRCFGCDLIYIDPMLAPERLHTLYPSDDYYAYQDYSYKETKLHIVLRFLKFLLLGNIHLKIPLKRCDQKILDIGCGSGKFLYDYRGKGLQVYGIEIDKGAADKGNHLGLNIINSTLIEANFLSSYFDIIRSNHSFEHIDNPSETIKEISRVIKKGGHLLIGVPNTKSIQFKVFSKYWFYLTIPFHPFNYNEKPIKILLERNGFIIIKKTYVGNHLGLAGSIQLWLNRNKPQRGSNGFFLNIGIAIVFHQIARLLNILQIGDCIEIMAIKK